MHVIIVFGRSEGPRVEGNGVEFPIGGLNGVYHGDGRVQGIGLYDLGCIRDPMGKDGSGGECEFEHVESALAVGVETPWGILLKKSGLRDDDIRVPRNKTTIEICKSKEGLNIADILGLRPVKNDLNLLLVHADSRCRAVET